jgi:ferric-dicitrate binding protein FerR (iron transport regulator)
MPGSALHRICLSLLFWLTLLFGCPLAEAAAQIRAGTVIGIQGNAGVERNGQTTPAALTTPIMEGDTIATAERASMTVGLIDGSRLTLSESSSIVIYRVKVEPAIAGLANRFFVKLFNGALGSVVTPAIENSAQFEVHTPNAVVGVRGTDFETKYIEGKPCPGFPQCLRYTDVGVYKGIVEVSNPTSAKAAAVQLTSGYETTVPCELPPAAPGPLGMGELTAPGYR